MQGPSRGWVGPWGNSARTLQKHEVFNGTFFRLAIRELTQCEQAALQGFAVRERGVSGVGLTFDAHEAEMHEVRGIRRRIHKHRAVKCILREAIRNRLAKRVEEVISGMQPDAVGQVSVDRTIETDFCSRCTGVYGSKAVR